MDDFAYWVLLKCLCKQRLVSNVSFDKVVSPMIQVQSDIGPLDRRVIEIIEVVEADNFLASLQQAVNQMRSDEACSSCDQ
jgi:hypothetical protein